MSLLRPAPRPGDIGPFGLSGVVPTGHCRAAGRPGPGLRPVRLVCPVGEFSASRHAGGTGKGCPTPPLEKPGPRPRPPFCRLHARSGKGAHTYDAEQRAATAREGRASRPGLCGVPDAVPTPCSARKKPRRWRSRTRHRPRPPVLQAPRPLRQGRPHLRARPRRFPCPTAPAPVMEWFLEDMRHPQPARALRRHVRRPSPIANHPQPAAQATARTAAEEGMPACRPACAADRCERGAGCCVPRHGAAVPCAVLSTAGALPVSASGRPQNRPAHRQRPPGPGPGVRGSETHAGRTLRVTGRSARRVVRAGGRSVMCGRRSGASGGSGAGVRTTT